MEAQINAIPVVASARGALPDTVGAGGILIDAHAPISDWEDALRLAHTPSPTYNQLSDRARHQAFHTAASPVILGRFVSALAGHAGSQ